MGLCTHSKFRIHYFGKCHGYALKQFNGEKNSIVVKGLAEKPIQADLARWEIHLQTRRAFRQCFSRYQLLDQE